MKTLKNLRANPFFPGERHQTVIAQYLVGWGRSPAVNSCPKILMGIAGAKFVFFYYQVRRYRASEELADEPII